MSAREIGLSPRLWNHSAEVVDVREALALANVDVVRPEHLDVDSALAGRVNRPAAADDLRLPRSPMKAKSVAHLKAAVRSVREKSAQPLATDATNAEKIFRLSAFLQAYESLQQEIDSARQPLD
jgi:hypothetical protein